MSIEFQWPNKVDPNGPFWTSIPDENEIKKILGNIIFFFRL